MVFDQPSTVFSRDWPEVVVGHPTMGWDPRANKWVPCGTYRLSAAQGTYAYFTDGGIAAFNEVSALWPRISSISPHAVWCTDGHWYEPTNAPPPGPPKPPVDPCVARLEELAAKKEREEISEDFWTRELIKLYADCPQLRTTHPHLAP
jgi:hypothetical protein